MMCFTTALPTKSTIHHGFTTAPPTKSTIHHGFTTAPATKSTIHHGFTTALATKSTNHHGFTTAPATKSTNHHGFTTAPATKSTNHHGFTTAPATKSTNHHGFTTAPATKSTNHHGFTTAPATKITVTPTNHIIGQWTEWTAWSACLETDPNVQGTKERMRQCYDPGHQHTDVCTHNHTEKDITYCFGGQPDACTPPQITDIKIVNGTWALTKLVIVKCFVSGNPMPDVRWLRHTDDVQIYPNDNSKIIIGPIENRHEGSYVCEAFNKCKQSISKSFSTPALTPVK
ncbi:uncharacterized protein LOC132748146 [Ruditapes philippinarum]|uniref:uncharacterized protein LOC132748146 n=1 Tax=Ruditapes philippinarum TaxID=129788 RepID=UPI00295C1FC9|nr:uncharacterized protein LOC132748146 [Ruditapes philippinarum]